MLVLSKTVDIVVKGNTYSVKFPNTGQMIDISVYKNTVTNNRYEYLKFSMDAEMQKVSVMVDAIATFRSIAPDLIKDLNVKSIFDLEITEVAEIVDAYENTYLPWYEQWLNFLKNPKGTENA